MSNYKRGDLFWPVIIILIWVYYSLRNIFQIDILSVLDLSFSKIWPIAILIYGVYIFIKNFNKDK